MRSVDEITIHLVANHGYGALKDRAALLAKLKSAKPRLTRKQFEKLLQKLCAEVAGGCFYVGPGDGEQGECADGDCYCSKTVKQHVEDFIKAGVEVQE